MCVPCSSLTGWRVGRTVRTRVCAAARLLGAAQQPEGVPVVVQTPCARAHGEARTRHPDDLAAHMHLCRRRRRALKLRLLLLRLQLLRRLAAKDAAGAAAQRAGGRYLAAGARLRALPQGLRQQCSGGQAALGRRGTACMGWQMRMHAGRQAFMHAPACIVARAARGPCWRLHGKAGYRTRAVPGRTSRARRGVAARDGLALGALLPAASAAWGASGVDSPLRSSWRVLGTPPPPPADAATSLPCSSTTLTLSVCAAVGAWARLS